MLWCSTCGLVFSCWELSHVIFLMLRKKELLAKLSKFTKWQLFSLKMVLGCHLSENSTVYVVKSSNLCHNWKLLIFRIPSSYLLRTPRVSELKSKIQL
jgi:hypothetical protein